MSEEKQGQWVSQGDIAGRLRLLRYGLVVATIVVFLVAWLVPYAVAGPFSQEVANAVKEAKATNPDLDIGVPEPFTLTDSLTWGIAAGVITAIVSVIVYFVYREVLKRAVGGAT